MRYSSLLSLVTLYVLLGGSSALAQQTDGDTRISPSGEPQIYLERSWHLDVEALLGTAKEQTMGDAGDFWDDTQKDDPKTWAPSVLKEAIQGYDQYVTITADSTQLEIGKFYKSDGFSVIMPPDPEVGDKVTLYNTNPAISDTRVPVSGGSFYVAGLEVFPTSFAIPAGLELTAVFDGTNWRAPIFNEVFLSLSSSQHDGKEIRGTVQYGFASYKEDAYLRLPPFPLGIMHIFLEPGSTHPLEIRQANMDGPAQLLREDNTVEKSITIPIEEASETVVFKGNPGRGEAGYWHTYRPWVATARRQTLWLDNSTDTPAIGRKNIYPSGTQLSAVPRPEFIENSTYTIETISEDGGFVGDKITYLAKGSGESREWVQETESTVDILDNVSFSLSSGGTNAGSNVSLTFFDIDGDAYPHQDWVYNGRLFQYSGGDAEINFIDKTHTGVISIGRNKQSDGRIEFTYIGTEPNGFSRIGFAPVSGARDSNVRIDFEGSNKNYSYATAADVGSVPWTSEPPEISIDQAAPWVPGQEYLAGTVLTHTEHDPETPDAERQGQPWVWSVRTGQLVAQDEFATWDDTDFSIQEKLIRHGVGIVEGEDYPALPVGGVAELDKIYVAIAPINANNVVRNGEYFVRSKIAAIPDPIDGAFWNTQLNVVGQGVIPGNVYKHVSGTGTQALSLNDIDNTEFVSHIVPAGVGQEYIFSHSDVFIGVWDDLTAGRVTTSSAPGDSQVTFAVQGPTQLIYTRDGNSAKFTFTELDISGAVAANTQQLQAIQEQSADPIPEAVTPVIVEEVSDFRLTYIEPDSSETATGALLLDYEAVQFIHDGMNEAFGGNGELFMPDPPTDENGDAIDSKEIFVEMRADNKVNWTIEDQYGVSFVRSDGSGAATILTLPAGTRWAFKMSEVEQAWVYRQVLQTAVDTPSELTIIDDATTVGGLGVLALFGDPKRYQIDRAVDTPMQFPTDGGANEGLWSIVSNKGEGTVTIGTVEIGPDMSAIVTADGGVDPAHVQVIGGAEAANDAIITMDGDVDSIKVGAYGTTMRLIGGAEYDQVLMPSSSAENAGQQFDVINDSTVDWSVGVGSNFARELGGTDTVGFIPVGPGEHMSATSIGAAGVVYWYPSREAANDPVLTPQDADVTLIDVEGVGGTFYSFSTGETWTEIKANYENLRFDINTSRSGSNAVRSNTVFIDPKTFSTLAAQGGYWITQDSQGTGVRVDVPIDSSTGFTYRQVNGDAPTAGRMRFRVTGLKKRVTVIAIDPADTFAELEVSGQGNGTMTSYDLGSAVVPDTGTYNIDVTQFQVNASQGTGRVSHALELWTGANGTGEQVFRKYLQKTGPVSGADYDLAIAGDDAPYRADTPVYLIAGQTLYLRIDRNTGTMRSGQTATLKLTQNTREIIEATPTKLKIGNRLTMNGILAPSAGNAVVFEEPCKVGSSPTIIAVVAGAGTNRDVTIQNYDHTGFNAWVVFNNSEVGASGELHWQATCEAQ